MVASDVRAPGLTAVGTATGDVGGLMTEAAWHRRRASPVTGAGPATDTGGVGSAGGPSVLVRGTGSLGQPGGGAVDVLLDEHRRLAVRAGELGAEQAERPLRQRGRPVVLAAVVLAAVVLAATLATLATVGVGRCAVMAWKSGLEL